MFKHAATAALLYSIVMLSSIALNAAAAQPAEPDLRSLIEQLDDPSPNAISAAEAIFEKLPTGGAKVKGAYALALLHAHQGNCDKAAELLNTALPQDRLPLPLLRLRLWLAVERNENDTAKRLYTDLVEQASRPETPAAERTASVRLLGHLAGVSGGADDATPDRAQIEKAVAKLKNAGEAKWLAEFKSSEQSAAATREKFNTLTADSSTNPADLAIRLTKAEANFQKLEQEWQAAKATHSQGLKSQRTEAKERAGMIPPLAQRVRALEQESRVQTPGHPQRPTRPTEPRRPGRRTDSKGNIDEAQYQRDLTDYESEMRFYRDRLREYEQAVRNYPQRLANWQALDKQRRENIKQQIAAAQSEIQSLRDQEKARKDAAGKVRDDVMALAKDVKAAETRRNLLKKLSAAKGEISAAQLVARPSNYDWLSLPQEQQRLLQSLE